MKVEFFESDDLNELKKQINEYIQSYTPKDIIKIEYNTVFLSHQYIGKDVYNEFSYSVMIVTDRGFKSGNSSDDTVPKAETYPPMEPNDLMV